MIQLIDGDELEVQDTVEEIDRAIGDLRTGRVPLIQVHRPDGQKLRINAAHIKIVREYAPSAHPRA